MKYRVVEFMGKFRVQKEVITSESYGFLNLRKKEVIKWRDLDKYGKESNIFRKSKRITKPTEYYNSLEQANKAIKEFGKEVIYHYI